MTAPRGSTESAAWAAFFHETVKQAAQQAFQSGYFHQTQALAAQQAFQNELIIRQQQDYTSLQQAQVATAAGLLSHILPQPVKVRGDYPWCVNDTQH